MVNVRVSWKVAEILVAYHLHAQTVGPRFRQMVRKTQDW